jgi:hypothetical protein
MSSFTTRCTSTPGTVIVQNQNGDYFTSSERFLLKSCLNKLGDYDVPSSIISSLTNKIDWTGSSSDQVTIKVTDKIYSFMEWSNIQGKVLNPKDYGFKKPSTISIGFVSGAAPMPMMMGGPSIGVVGATPMYGYGATPSFAVSGATPSFAVSGAYSRKSSAVVVPTPRIVITTSSSRKSSSKSSDYFHDVLSWREAKSKIGYEHRHRQFHEWCKKKGWNFSFSDDSASIPGRYVIEFNKNKWNMKKKDARRDCVDMLPSM